MPEIMSNSIDPINEAYFGETDDIRKMQLLINKIRLEAKKTNMTKINSSKTIIEFNRVVEETFGFRCFVLRVSPDLSYGAFTSPVSNKIDIINPHKKLSIDKRKGFKFEKNMYSVVTFITYGLLKNEEFTDREIMAIILHEIGHSFTNAYTNNSLLGHVSKVITVAGVIERFIVNLLLNQTVDISGIMLSNNFMYVYNEIDKKVRSNKFISQYLDTISASKNFISKIINEFMMFMNRVGNISMIFNPLTLIPILIRFLSNLTPFSILGSIVGYRDEQLSDNFTTAYGYGSDISSALLKLEYGDKGSFVNKAFRKDPAMNQLSTVVSSTLEFLFHATSTHPSTVSRVKNQLDMLNHEFNKSDIDPKMKKVIKEDIVEIEKLIKKNYINKPKDIDPDRIDKLYAGYMYKKYNGDARSKNFKTNPFKDLDKAVNKLAK